MNPSSSRLNRRAFLQQAGAAALAFPFVSRLGAASANDILQHVSFGASGMAGADWDSIVGTQKARLVAVAEVDMNRAADAKKRFPDVKVYQDWRELLDKEGKNFDSANVSTPDHMHAPIGLAAIQLGKHVYVQKPLTHNIQECRQMLVQAQRAKVVTQMGIQIHSSREYRLAVQFIRDLAIGKVKEVHTWSNKTWGDMNPRPNRTDPVPAGFDWNLWLGVATDRPFIQGYYHPGDWRRRLDFGTGTFGDMGCHIYDPVFKALALTAPLAVRSEGPQPNADNWAINAIIRYVFPGTPYTAGKTVNVTWYDGNANPPAEIIALLGTVPKPDQGSIFIGTDGIMLLPHIGRPVLLPEEKFENHEVPPIRGTDHYAQFVNACRGEGQTSAGFDYSAPLTETVLLGGVATRFPNTTLEWNSEKLKFTNESDANQYVKRVYRAGWEPKWI